ncbi:hypothetical protein TIFTF001_054494 [Ficus carica]|uniref:Uncharacterized protein n=1 Tax=Ficus carica TaxID=3494 RepID=A0AA88JFC2_FICCA|nr:hypothetical protein TIFTF001_054494 [Ficus carica]
MPRHRRGTAKCAWAWAAKPAWLGQMDEFCITQASVARTGPQGRGRVGVQAWVRPVTVECVWDADRHEMNASGASGYPIGRDIWGQGPRDSNTWPMTQIAVGTSLDCDSGQIHSVHLAKTERAKRAGQVAGQIA